MISLVDRCKDVAWNKKVLAFLVLTVLLILAHFFGPVTSMGLFASELPERGPGEAKSDGGIGIQGADGLQVTPLRPDEGEPTEDDKLRLAKEIFGEAEDTVTIIDVKFQGTWNSAGFFEGPKEIIGFEEGVILSTGFVENVVGPNTSDMISGINNLPGDPDLDALIPGYTTYDATWLEIRFIPMSSVLTFSYVFASDEYPEFVGTAYNDVFGFFVNGVNKALLPVTNEPVAINNVNHLKNSQYYRDNHLPDSYVPDSLDNDEVMIFDYDYDYDYDDGYENGSLWGWYDATYGNPYDDTMYDDLGFPVEFVQGFKDGYQDGYEEGLVDDEPVPVPDPDDPVSKTKINTEMDGLTTVLNFTANVTPGQINTIKLAIADAGDQIYDSNVFIKTASGQAVNPVPVTSVFLTKTSTYLNLDRSEQLFAQVEPINATNQSVTWTSSNPGVASVSPTGVVTGHQSGTAIITATTDDGKHTATCQVTVSEDVVHVDGVTLSPAVLSVAPGTKANLTATINPDNATNQNLTWSSSDTTVATVGNGVVNALKKGHAVITVKTEDGDHKATSMVKVEEAAPDDINVTITQIDSSGFPFIENYVSVTDQEGESITGLTVDDFTLTEQAENEASPTTEIISVQELLEDETNISVALVIDTSGSMGWQQMGDAKNAAKTFIDSLQDGDRAAVIEFNNTVNVVSHFTGDKDELIKAVDSLQAGGMTAMRDAIWQAAELLRYEDGAKCVLMFTDGDDNKSNYTRQEVIDHANYVGVPVYTIAFGALVQHKDILQIIANETNGVFYDAPDADELLEIYYSVAKKQRSQYLVTYNTHNPLTDGTERDVHVQVGTSPVESKPDDPDPVDPPDDPDPVDPPDDPEPDAVKADELDVDIIEAAPGLYHVIIPFESALKVWADLSEDCILILDIEDKDNLELVYSVLAGKGKFEKFYVSGYTEDEIRAATVQPVCPPDDPVQDPPGDDNGVLVGADDNNSAPGAKMYGSDTRRYIAPDEAPETKIIARDVDGLSKHPVTVPIFVDYAPDFYGAFIRVEYDPAVAICTDVIGRDFAKDYTVTSRLEEADEGHILVELVHADGNEISGSGYILDLVFDAHGAPGSTTTIEIVDPRIFNEMGASLDIEAQHGSLNLLPAILYGDANQDGEVDTGDVVVVNNHILRKYTLTGTGWLAADVNADGIVNIGDSNLISRKNLGYIDQFPAETDQASPFKTQSTPSFELESKSNITQDEFTAALSVSDAGEFFAGNFVIDYDPTMLKLKDKSIERSAWLGDYSLTHDIKAHDGVADITISHIGDQPVSGSGDLLLLTFEVKVAQAAMTQVKLEEAYLTDTDGMAMKGPITHAIYTFHGYVDPDPDDPDPDDPDPDDPVLYWQNTATGLRYLWFMDGLKAETMGGIGTFGAGVWNIVGVGDLDGDGKTDIVWHNTQSGLLYAWMMDGRTQLAAGGIGTVENLDWRATAVGDMNGNGNPDIIWENTENGRRLVWFMDGLNVVNQELLAEQPDPTWSIVAAADMNGNGQTDLILQNAGEGSREVWLMNGLVREQVVPFAPGLGPEWQIAAAGDINHSGHNDIVWENHDNGLRYVWFMEGLDRVDGGGLGTISDMSWQIVGLR